MSERDTFGYCIDVTSKKVSPDFHANIERMLNNVKEAVDKMSDAEVRGVVRAALTPAPGRCCDIAERLAKRWKQRALDAEAQLRAVNKWWGKYGIDVMPNGARIYHSPLPEEMDELLAALTTGMDTKSEASDE